MDQPPRTPHCWLLLTEAPHWEAELLSSLWAKGSSYQSSPYLALKLLRQILSLKALKTKLKNNIRAGSQIIAAPADNPILGQGRYEKGNSRPALAT